MSAGTANRPAPAPPGPNEPSLGTHPAKWCICVSAAARIPALSLGGRKVLYSTGLLHSFQNQGDLLLPALAATAENFFLVLGHLETVRIFHPVPADLPTPRRGRPSENRSTSDACLAKRSVCRCGRMITPVTKFEFVGDTGAEIGVR